MVQPGPTARSPMDEQDNLQARAEQQLNDTKESMGERLSDAEQNARETGADRLDDASRRVSDAADSLPGPLAGGAERAAEGLEHSAEYVRSKAPGDMVSDVEEYVRDHPVQGLAMAIAAGFVVGRVLK